MSSKSEPVCPRCGGKLIPVEDITTDGRLSRVDELGLVCERGDWSADSWMGDDKDDPATWDAP